MIHRAYKNLAICLLWWSIMSSLEQITDAFSPANIHHQPTTPSSSKASFCPQRSACRQSPTLFLASSPNENTTDADTDDSSSSDFTDFNPFSYQTDPSQRRSTLDAYAGTQISLRKTRMQALTNDLLNSVQDPLKVQALLESNRDFLLEPLDMDGAVLDPDSVYTRDMTRTTRYAAYRTAMQTRMETAKNVGVKKVLVALYDYITSHE